ncbi:Glycoside hydrolase, family 77, partial [human gut metagenome]
HALSIYDILRIDHFRGFDTYWAIPAGDKNARGGKWEQGPGMDLFRALRTALGDLPIVAEDLGEIFDSVRVLLAESGFPGMKVLQFSLNGTDSLTCRITTRPTAWLTPAPMIITPCAAGWKTKPPPPSANRPRHILP